MLWGSSPARIDEKFRLKVPAKFRRELGETDNNFFVTSYDGKCAQIYPVSVWERLSQKFLEPPRMDPAKAEFEPVDEPALSHGQLLSAGPAARVTQSARSCGRHVTAFELGSAVGQAGWDGSLWLQAPAPVRRIGASVGERNDGLRRADRLGRARLRLDVGQEREHLVAVERLLVEKRRSIR